MLTLTSINNKKAGFFFIRQRRPMVKLIKIYIFKNKQKIKFTYMYNFCKTQVTKQQVLLIHSFLGY